LGLNHGYTFNNERFYIAPQNAEANSEAQVIAHRQIAPQNAEANSEVQVIAHRQNA